MAAHAYSRLAKRPGVCMTPLGPGTTNALTGLTNALLDAAPVLLIGGLTRNRIAAVNATSGAVTAWDPNASSTVKSLAVET